jgi:hypothetical protein
MGQSGPAVNAPFAIWLLRATEGGLFSPDAALAALGR